MLMNRNLLENVTFFSSSSTVVCALLNYVTNVSPLTGYWFLAYTLFIFVISIIFSVKIIQWFLRLNKPLKYNLAPVIAKYPFASILLNILPDLPKKCEAVNECKDYDTNELSVITTVLEKKLVSSWYINYISQEISFPFACKQMLDQMISRAFQICNKIETKELYVHVCAILISHIKEYKKALKRQEKSPTKTVDSLYKKMHQISDSNNRKSASADHCVNIIRIILKELVPWELWDTPHSELLVRILAKRLDTFIDTTISDPIWINDRLLTILTASKDAEPDTKEEKNDLEVKETAPPEDKQENENITQSVDKRDVPEPATKKPDMKIVEENNKCDEAKEVLPISEPVEIKPVLRQRRGRQGKNEVKIYDRIIEGSVKTWETDMDLQCISMGQDLLASLDELSLSRLWGHEDTETSPNLRGNSPQPLWFGEEDAIDLDPEPAKEPKSSPKATDALLKDIQSTVHQAKTRIGDLQVPLHVDKRPSDEAAGMMEGLLDKGIAGIKKGLRFTGLSDDSQEKSPSHQRDRSGDKISPEGQKQRGKLDVVTEYRDIKEYNTSYKDDGNSVPPLVKQQRVSSQDGTSQKPRLDQAQFSLSESPEPQYEEAADLSHTIAKLRTLLNEATPRNEDIWWETAVETRGRIQSQPSERHVDTATFADEYDMNLERNPSPGQTSNNMQRLDKLFQRTVTGVFNSIKTAVGAEGEGEPPRQWTYVTTNMEISVGGAVARLVGSRRAMSHVDTALDTLQQLPANPAPAPPSDDFEEWCVERARWSGACELLCELGLCEEHVCYRIATLLLAEIVEAIICAWLEDLTAWTRKQVFASFEKMSQSDAEPEATGEMRDFDIDETCRVIMENLPKTYVFGRQSLARAIRLLVSSFSHKGINKDVQYRGLDLFVAHFKKSAGLRSHSFDSN